MIRFIDIKPGDIGQALAYYRQCVSDRTWSPEKAQSLIRIQNDPDALILAIAKLNAT